MAVSLCRGHEIWFDHGDSVWRYVDNGNEIDEMRPCAKCGKMPTKEGYDACLGYIPGAVSACCGHGVRDEFIVRRCEIAK